MVSVALEAFCEIVRDQLAGLWVFAQHDTQHSGQFAEHQLIAVAAANEVGDSSRRLRDWAMVAGQQRRRYGMEDLMQGIVGDVHDAV